ncbi:hypothetical protein NEOLEDRAFT_1061268, partial [Neolentinus lepideus HHB14362 ss-1]
AVDHFIRLANMTDEVPRLKGKYYSDFALSDREWEFLQLVHQVLQEPSEAHQNFSSMNKPTLWAAIPILENLQNGWESMAKDSHFSQVKDAINAGLDNLRKWYKKTDASSAYFIMHMLDPRWKLAYVTVQWDHELVASAKTCFEAEFDRYYCAVNTSSNSSTMATQHAGAASVSGMSLHNAEMMVAVKLHREEDQCHKGPHEELEMYLSSPLEPADLDDIVRWWGHHQVQYPVLAWMARDYLAIQGSAVTSERAFSSGGITSSP